MTGTSPISHPVFSRSAVISWGKSIGISPDDALNFMQSEGVVIVDENVVPRKVIP